MDLLLDDVISKTEHDEKRTSLLDCRDKIIDEIERHNAGDDNFTDRVVSLLELASGAYDAFMGSDNDKKRRILNLVFLTLNGRKLEYTLRPPFDSFVKCSNILMGGAGCRT